MPTLLYSTGYSVKLKNVLIEVVCNMSVTAKRLLVILKIDNKVYSTFENSGCNYNFNNKITSKLALVSDYSQITILPRRSIS